MKLIDSHGREIRYLRLSVTTRCNMRCRYCLPTSDKRHKRHEGPSMTDEEILRLCRVFASAGVDKIRVTGGEPLVRKGILNLLAGITAIPSVRDVSLTTNGALLKKYAADIAAAGVRRINVSLDTLRNDRFAAITRGGSIDDIMEGLTAAEAAGLKPIKLNFVVMRGVNDDEVFYLALLTRERAWHVRFIELMPIGPAGANWRDMYVSSQETRERIESSESLAPVSSERHSAERLYKLPGAKGLIGFISSVSEPFCSSCNRLRVMSDGRLRVCLGADASVDLAELMRNGASDSEILKCAKAALAAKPSVGARTLAETSATSMAGIGG